MTVAFQDLITFIVAKMALIVVTIAASITATSGFIVSARNGFAETCPDFGVSTT